MTIKDIPQVDHFADRQLVLMRLEDGTAWVTLNRPGSLNAMDDRLMDDLRDALAEIALDSNIRCVVLSGAGTSFCAGGDARMLDERRSKAASAPSIGALMEDQHQLLLRRSESSVLLATMPKPTIAMLHGHVIGGGLALALACDFRIAGSRAQLRAGFRANGLSGDFGIAYLLEGMLGVARAKEVLMLDPVLSAADALAYGLVTSVHPDEELAGVVHEFVGKLEGGPTIALGRMKSNLLGARTLSMTNAIELEATNQRVATMTSDAAEAGQAFANRRAPTFKGR